MATKPLRPFRIDPKAIYDDAALVLGLGFTTATLTRERRAGRLKFIKRGRRILYRGRDVANWLTTDPDQQSSKTAKGAHNDR